MLTKKLCVKSTVTENLLVAVTSGDPRCNTVATAALGLKKLCKH